MEDHQEIQKSPLEEALEDIINARTFSQESLEKIVNLQRKVKENTRQLDRYSRETQELRAKNNRLEEIIRERDKRIETQSASLSEQVTKIRQLEAAAANYDKLAAVAQAESRTLDRCFNLIFRNQTINRTVTESVPVAVKNKDTPPGQCDPSGMYNSTGQVLAGGERVETHSRTTNTTESKE